MPVESPYQYLLLQYDEDGDGVIRKAEYPRGADVFARLDTDGDGELTDADFQVRGRRVRVMNPVAGRQLRARHLLAWYFQDDRDPARIDVEEVVCAMGAFDRDGDGQVGRSEFEALAAARSAHGRVPDGAWWGLLEVETTDPWERLVEGVDQGRDGFVSEKDVRAFFAASEPGAWSFVSDATAGARARVGVEAPDFSLPVVDGRTSVTLSSFAHRRPVALIFGSYT